MHKMQASHKVISFLFRTMDVSSYGPMLKGYMMKMPPERFAEQN